MRYRKILKELIRNIEKIWQNNSKTDFDKYCKKAHNTLVSTQRGRVLTSRGELKHLGGNIE